MEPKIIDKPVMYLLGFDFFGDPFKFSAGWTEENEIGRLWKRFMAFYQLNKGQIGQFDDPSVMYEIHIEHPETAQTGEYEVFVGVEVADFENVPIELTAKVLPSTLYAVFTLRGEQIISDWHSMVHKEWMPESGYQTSFSYGMQCYDHRFKGLDRIDESELELYIPVEKASANR